MKRVNSRLKVDTLYILGAGASYALSHVKPKKNGHIRFITPLDKDFLFSINETKPNTGWRKRSTEILESNWLDEDNIFDNGLERAVIKRVSQYDLLHHLNPVRTRRKCSNEEYLSHLTHLVTYYLMKCKSNSSGFTRLFIDSVFPKGTKPEDYKNRIITFNYDSIVDKPLVERGISTKKIFFDRIVKERHDGTKREADEKFPHPLILKLHGSASWRSERVNFDKMIFGNVDVKEKFPIWFDNSKTPQPDDDESPLIIPPIPNKPITRSSLFKFLWTVAFEYMHEAKRIVIVGYSCPLTDTLARSMFTHFRSRKLEEISVVDPNALALSNYKEMTLSNVPKSCKWKYYGSFVEYLQNELQIKKAS